MAFCSGSPGGYGSTGYVTPRISGTREDSLTRSAPRPSRRLHLDRRPKSPLRAFTGGLAGAGSDRGGGELVLGHPTLVMYPPQSLFAYQGQIWMQSFDFPGIDDAHPSGS